MYIEREGDVFVRCAFTILGFEGMISCMWTMLPDRVGYVSEEHTQYVEKRRKINHSYPLHAE